MHAAKGACYFGEKSGRECLRWENQENVTMQFVRVCAGPIYDVVFFRYNCPNSVSYATF